MNSAAPGPQIPRHICTRCAGPAGNHSWEITWAQMVNESYTMRRSKRVPVCGACHAHLTQARQRFFEFYYPLTALLVVCLVSGFLFMWFLGNQQVPNTGAPFIVLAMGVVVPLGIGVTIWVIHRRLLPPFAELDSSGNVRFLNPRVVEAIRQSPPPFPPMQSALADLLTRAEQGEAMARLHDDRQTLAKTLQLGGKRLAALGRFPEAAVKYSEEIELRRAFADDQEQLAAALLSLACILVDNLDEPGKARPLLAEANELIDRHHFTALLPQCNALLVASQRPEDPAG